MSVLRFIDVWRKTSYANCACGEYEFKKRYIEGIDYFKTMRGLLVTLEAADEFISDSKKLDFSYRTFPGRERFKYTCHYLQG